MSYRGKENWVLANRLKITRLFHSSHSSETNECANGCCNWLQSRAQLTRQMQMRSFSLSDDVTAAMRQTVNVVIFSLQCLLMSLAARKIVTQIVLCFCSSAMKTRVWSYMSVNCTVLLFVYILGLKSGENLKNYWGHKNPTVMLTLKEHFVVLGKRF